MNNHIMLLAIVLLSSGVSEAIDDSYIEKITSALIVHRDLTGNKQHKFISLYRSKEDAGDMHHQKLFFRLNQTRPLTVRYEKAVMFRTRESWNVAWVRNGVFRYERKEYEFTVIP
ncbi:MAG: hypothetical protein H7A51_04985 [Akkermansiaceae bacterium]|nr:hypothetical protein [Akkermansiaceae bacterium]